MILNELLLTQNFSDLQKIEESVKSIVEIKEYQRNAMLIITTEFFTNIVEHAKLTTKESAILLRICNEGKFFVEFEYKTSNFDAFLKGFYGGKPYFDEKSKRYRGLGLRMIENLSDTVETAKIDKNTNLVSVKIWLLD